MNQRHELSMNIGVVVLWVGIGTICAAFAFGVYTIISLATSIAGLLV